MYPGKRLIHLFVDNARYHHAKLVQAWLADPHVLREEVPRKWSIYCDQVTDSFRIIGQRILGF